VRRARTDPQARRARDRPTGGARPLSHAVARGVRRPLPRRSAVAPRERTAARGPLCTAATRPPGQDASRGHICALSSAWTISTVSRVTIRRDRISASSASCRVSRSISARSFRRPAAGCLLTLLQMPKQLVHRLPSRRPSRDHASARRRQYRRTPKERITRRRRTHTKHVPQTNRTLPGSMVIRSQGARCPDLHA
jgi:hypothetical protein